MEDLKRALPADLRSGREEAKPCEIATDAQEKRFKAIAQNNSGTAVALHLRFQFGQAYRLLARFAVVNFCRGDQGHGGDDYDAPGEDVSIEALAQHQPSEKNRDDGIHIGVRRHLVRGYVL